MMLGEELKDAEIDEIFYRVSSKSKLFSVGQKKKITKVDSDGNEWHRYIESNNVPDAEVKCLRLIGKVGYEVHGEVNEDEICTMLYFVDINDPDNQLELPIYIDDEQHEYGSWFSDIGDAEAYKDELKTK